MIVIKNSFIICTVLAIAAGGVVKVPNKCNISDNDCNKKLYQKLFKQTADGIPDLNIPPADPLPLKNGVTTLPNALKLILEDGVATGFKDCDFTDVGDHLEFYPHYAVMNLTCDIKINGKYTVEVPKSVMIELGGEDTGADLITGSGNGKATFDKLHITLITPIDLVWRDNNVYLHGKHENMYHDAHDAVVFSITDLDVGNKINGEKIANYLKQQAPHLHLMSPAMDKIIEFFQAFLDNYLTQIPATDLYYDASNLKSYI